ncbi:hypothetical protein OG552_21315 [Streptomyces sp. NBC_01476]|uniref:imidazolonepropionase-like domain-containing protein n=1 Tax=Streptomyces sp. NBC_01476 TaxID=2903881 RepID=UPI002E2FD028|nr:hypothetical protein [Streptomyces sp. NBC_01476]
MLTLHTAGLLLPGGGRAAVPGGGVLVDGDRIAALGAAGELTPAYPAARVRTWPGTLRAGLVHTGPLPAAATARERVHAVLRLGACALTSPDLTDAERAAASRLGVLLVPVGSGPADLTAGGRADLAVLLPDGTCVATVVAGRLLHRRA